MLLQQVMNDQLFPLPGPDTELTVHDGTVRDLVFQAGSHSPMLVSGGAGDCNICITDCVQQQTINALSGHTGKLVIIGSTVWFKINLTLFETHISHKWNSIMNLFDNIDKA